MSEITVSDTGIGISPESRDDIFKSFEQVDASGTREYGGTGLGLSITRQLVKLHGGTIRVYSEAGQGSAFTFSLPLCKEKAEVTDLSTEVSRIKIYEEDKNGTQITTFKESETEKIFAVDYEPVNLQVLINHLSLNNYQVLQATSGKEALRICQSSKPPDIIYQDTFRIGKDKHGLWTFCAL